ncbi:unnamed protein product [Durusdinium trenchii]|uniref:Lysyl-tRNA synthetase n=1 Tax=Durusdinium trenchii TaxID=1381693 RepID=A0ABP0Q369_9DINO
MSSDSSDDFCRKRRVSLRSSPDVYPHAWRTNATAEELRRMYGHLPNGGRVQGVKTLAGRLVAQRDFGKLRFMVVVNESTSIQIVCDSSTLIDSTRINRNDVVGVEGEVGKTRKGELSVFATKLQLLAPCWHNLPVQQSKLDPVLKCRRRYLDLMTNVSSQLKFKKRAEIITSIRKYLKQRGFHEVETPILCTTGVASAQAVKTRSNELNMDLSLRTEPEVFLKMLLVGGFDRIFELGRCFRNASVDADPEHTTCELYMAYHDYNDLMCLVEDLFSSLVLHFNGSYQLEYHPDGCGDSHLPVLLDFTPPWPRVSIVEEVEGLAERQIPRDFNSEECNEVLEDIAFTNNVQCSEPRTPHRLLKKLFESMKLHHLLNPTFVIDPPMEASMAKEHRSKQGRAERFDLIISGKEISNGYSEQNDPHAQRAAFDQLKEVGVEDFLDALEHGLPPSAGGDIVPAHQSEGDRRLLGVLLSTKSAARAPCRACGS